MNAGMRAGYKQTEVGVIPEDWAERTVGELIEFQGGSQPEKSVFSAVPRPGFVRLIQIRDYKSDKFEVFAPAALLRRFCGENDILIGRYGPPVFQILRGLSGAYNVALIKASPLPAIDRDFAYFFLKQDSLFEFIDKLSRRSSGQTGVDLSELRRYPLPLPSLPEQRAIAAALSDVDALLAGLDRLIAKKRDLKQAAMQQLLTGQTRLPGFQGVWQTTRLRQAVATPITDGPHLTPKFLPTGVPFLSVNNLVNNRLDFSALRYISLEDHLEFSKKCKPKRGDILFGKAASVGMVALVETDMELNIWSPLALIRVTGKMNERFVFHVLQTRNIDRQIKLMTNASSQGNIGMSDIGMLEIPIPDVSEQTAIATVLSDMDAELSALEARRNKTRALKQAMMQELLTGKTRLV